MKIENSSLTLFIHRFYFAFYFYLTLVSAVCASNQVRLKSLILMYHVCIFHHPHRYILLLYYPCILHIQQKFDFPLFSFLHNSYRNIIMTIKYVHNACCFALLFYSSVSISNLVDSVFCIAQFFSSLYNPQKFPSLQFEMLVLSLHLL